jgi:serine O-acetyltransferase
MFENLRADLARLTSDEPGARRWRTAIRGVLSQGFQAILVYRFFSWLQRNKIPGQPLRFFAERFIEITTGISIPASCRIGPGLRIHHFGGVILHESVELGTGCTLYHEVTIGDRGGHGRAARVGDRAVFGAGAKVIGEITIGDDCIVGANALLRESLPDGTLAVGNPAVIKLRKDLGAEGQRGTGPEGQRGRAEEAKRGRGA